MKKSTNLFIAAIILLLLAVLISSDKFTEIIHFIRLLCAAGCCALLVLSGRAERKEDEEECREAQNVKTLHIELPETDFNKVAVKALQMHELTDFYKALDYTDKRVNFIKSGGTSHVDA